MACFSALMSHASRARLFRKMYMQESAILCPGTLNELVLKRPIVSMYPQSIGDSSCIRSSAHKQHGYNVNVAKRTSAHGVFTCLVVQQRNKSSSKKFPQSKVDLDSDEESDDEEKGRDFHIIKGHASSDRIDAVLKLALGMSRNKVDNAFYNSSIYLNGEKLMKKSEGVTIEDELDVVRGLNAMNPAFLDVSRVQVLDIHRSHDNDGKISVKLKRFKRLTIQNYRQSWKPAEE